MKAAETLDFGRKSIYNAPEGLKMKKRMIFGALFLLAASLLLAQNLVDVSKKEQERREKLKGKSVTVVTNADLKAKAKTPAVAAGGAEAAKPETEDQGETPSEAGAAAAAAPAAETEAQPESTMERLEYSPGYATSVFPEWFLVENPDLALGPPDGRFAEISSSGVLDLDINVNNGPGDDFAIYARPPVKIIPDAEKDNLLETDQDRMWWGDFRYAVLALDSRGEWQEIGMGSGANPDRFDLGALESTRRIRIMFKAISNPYNEGAKPPRLAGQDLTFGVDAVGALH